MNNNIFSGPGIACDPDKKITLEQKGISDDGLRLYSGSANSSAIIEITSGESDEETTDLVKSIKTEWEIDDIDISHCAEAKIEKCE